MKNLKNFPGKLVVRIGTVCILSVMLSSCLKDHGSDNPLPPVALLTVIQASPGQPPLNFSINGNRVNLNAMNFGDNIDYFSAYTGKRTFMFSTTASGTTVISDTATLKQNVAYSLCLVNKVSTPQLLLLKDTISQPASGNAGLRFVNLSPDAPAVDLAIKGGSVFVANKSFKGFSTFKAIQGNNYSFEIRQAGTTTVLATLNNVSLNTGFVYTVYLQGLVAATDASKLNANLVTTAHPSYN